MTEDRRTAFYDIEKERAARFVASAGWDVSVQCSGLVGEHQAVRTRAGLFDVSLMGATDVMTRGKAVAVRVLETPFYKREA